MLHLATHVSTIEEKVKIKKIKINKRRLIKTEHEHTRLLDFLTHYMFLENINISSYRRGELIFWKAVS